jgi:hypothetical protein
MTLFPWVPARAGRRDEQLAPQRRGCQCHRQHPRQEGRRDGPLHQVRCNGSFTNSRGRYTSDRGESAAPGPAFCTVASRTRAPTIPWLTIRHASTFETFTKRLPINNLPQPSENTMWWKSLTSLVAPILAVRRRSRAVRALQGFPWFREATIREITNVQLPSPHHLYWPDLDIDLAVESIEHPEKYPLGKPGAAQAAHPDRQRP